MAKKKGKDPQTFTYGGHRYRIFHITNTEKRAHNARAKRYGLSHASYRTAVKQLSDGRWVAGER